MKIKAAIFDMDGTLVDSLFLWNVLWETFGERYLGDKGFVPAEEDDKKVRALTLKDAMEWIHIRYGLGESGEELLRQANALIADFYANDVELKTGVLAFLEHCKRNGVKMCIASATAPEFVSLAVKHCGLEPYFSEIFSCGTLGKGKDCPDVFLRAAEFLGEDLSDTWVFEDSLVAIQTAVSIGMPTVGIYDRYNFGQEQIRQIATKYVGPGETLATFLDIDRG